MKEGRYPNTQIASFGAGHLFVQIFTCPDPAFVTDYRIEATRAGFIQIWPKSEAEVKFPAKHILNDEDADRAADAYAQRINAKTALSAGRS